MEGGGVFNEWKKKTLNTFCIRRLKSVFLSFSGCSDDELDEEATQHALWSVTVFEVWTFTDISSQKKIATTCEQTSAEPVMYVQCPDIRACY